MAGLGDIYFDTIKKHFTLRAVWKPGKILKLGDYGILKKGKLFSRMGNISKDFNIKFDIEHDESPADFEQFISQGSSNIKARAKGDVGLTGHEFINAGFSINFSHAKAVFIDARECYNDQITNIPRLSKKIAKLYNKGKGDWEKEYVLVTLVERAKAATVVVTSGKKASIDIEAKTAGPIKNISDSSVGLKVRNMVNVGYAIVGTKIIKLSMETMELRGRKGKEKLKPV